MPFFNYLADDAVAADAYQIDAATWDHWKRFSQALMYGPSPLGKGERQLIAAYVSVLNGCDYCYGGHAAAAVEFGIAEELLRALKDDFDAAPVEDRFRPILAFTRKLTETPARMTQADADAVFAAGWDERALHHVIAVTARYNFMNRIVDGHGIVADAGKFAARGKQHAAEGYL